MVLAILQYILRYHSVSFGRYFWLWSFLHAVFTQTVCASFAACTPKSAIIYKIVVTLTNFQICGCRTALISIQLTKIWRIIQQRVYRTKVNSGNLMQRLIDASAAVEHNMELLTMPLTSGAGVRLHACTRDISGYFDYSLWHKLVRTFKLSLKSLLSKTFLSDYRYFLDIYVSQGSVATVLRYGWIFNDHLIALFLLIPLVTKFENRLVNIWQSNGQEYGILFFTHRVYYSTIKVTNQVYSHAPRQMHITRTNTRCLRKKIPLLNLL